MLSFKMTHILLKMLLKYQTLGMYLGLCRLYIFKMQFLTFFSRFHVRFYKLLGLTVGTSYVLFAGTT
jgi:hypothetical protein